LICNNKPVINSIAGFYFKNFNSEQNFRFSSEFIPTFTSVLIAALFFVASGLSIKSKTLVVFAERVKYWTEGNDILARPALQIQQILSYFNLQNKKNLFNVLDRFFLCFQP
jgi:hypothetical protein